MLLFTAGGTDSKHYEHLTRHGTLRFVGYGAWREDLKRIHGTDERISLEAFQKALCVYKQGVTFFGNYSDTSSSSSKGSSSSRGSGSGSGTAASGSVGDEEAVAVA